jgi:hypothetical protein
VLPPNGEVEGCTEEPDGAEGAQFPSARGDKPEAPHGPLQRLLEGAESDRAGLTIYRSAAKEKLVEPAGSKAIESVWIVASLSMERNGTVIAPTVR